MTPLFIYQEVIPFDVAGQILGYFCKENFPNSFWNYSFTLMILLVQYLMPLMLLPIVHAKILIFLRKNSGFQNDSRRKEREIKRNKRMTKILSSISLIFAISWLPYHIYLILTDIFTLFQEKVSFSCFQFQSFLSASFSCSRFYIFKILVLVVLSQFSQIVKIFKNS